MAMGPDSDLAGYPVDFMDPIRIRPDAKSLDPLCIQICRIQKFWIQCTPCAAG